MAVERHGPDVPRYDRPSQAAKERRSRAKLVPHSHRRRPTHPDPATGRVWPPRGWTEAGIRNHEIAHNRTVAFLSTWGAADATTSGYAPISPATARQRELAQFGRDRTAAAAVLVEATTVVLDMRGFARADTHPIPRQTPPPPVIVAVPAATRRTGTA